VNGQKGYFSLFIGAEALELLAVPSIKGHTNYMKWKNTVVVGIKAHRGNLTCMGLLTYHEHQYFMGNGNMSNCTTGNDIVF
jgi:hypothetical protein